MHTKRSALVIAMAFALLLGSTSVGWATDEQGDYRE